MNHPKLLSQISTALILAGSAAWASGQTTPDSVPSPSTAPAPAAAATPPASTDDTVQLPSFNVTSTLTDQYRATDANSVSRVSGSISDLAGSVSVLTAQFLQDVGTMRLFDATRYEAGIVEGRGDGFSDRQIIRGFENLGRNVDNFNSIQAANADPLLIDHVEIVKGPSAILDPTGAPGGVVNVLSKAPLYKPYESASVEVGLIDAQRVDLDLSGPFTSSATSAYRFLGAFQDGRLASDHTKDRRKVIGGSVSFKLTPTTTLLVRGDFENRWLFVYFPVYFSSTSINGSNGTLAPGFQFGNNLNGTEPWAHRGGQYANSDILLTTTFGDHLSQRVAAKAQYNKEEDMFMFGATPSLSNRYNPYTGQETPDYTWALSNGTYASTYSPLFNVSQLQREPERSDGDTEDFSAQYDLAAKFNWAGVASTTIAGAALDHTVAATEVYVGPNLVFNLYAPVYGANPVFTTLNSAATTKVTTSEYYVNEQLGYFNNRLLLTAGAVKVISRQANSNLVTHIYTKLDDQRNVGLFGIVVKPVDHLSIYASRSENVVPTIANNLALWQAGIQYEFGAKATFFDDRLAFTFAHFQISQTNVTVPNPAYQTDPTQPQSLISDLKNHGYEYEVTGGITRDLSIVGSASFLEEKDSLGRPVRAIAGQSAGALLNYKFAPGLLRGLSVFGGVTYMGKRAGETPAVNFTPLGVPTQVSFFLAPVELVNLGARYGHGHLTYQLNVDNALDKHYIDIPTSRVNAGLGLPINVRLKVSYIY